MGTLIWSDNFESYASPISAPWTSITNTPISSTVAHGGTKSAMLGAGGSASNAVRALGSNVGPPFYADFWLNVNSSSSTNAFVKFYDTGLTDNGIALKPAGVSSGNGSVVLPGGGSAFTYAITNNVWHHILFEIVRAVAGTLKLTIDGVVVGTYAGNTRGSSNQTYVSAVGLVGASIGPSPIAEIWVDDLGTYSGTPYDPTKFLFAT